MRTSSSSVELAPQRTITPSDIDQVVEVNDLDNLKPLRNALGSDVRIASGFLIWNPDTARVTVYYERLGSEIPPTVDVPARAEARPYVPITPVNRVDFPTSLQEEVPATSKQSQPHSAAYGWKTDINQPPSTDLSQVAPLQIRQCCEALDEAERANKPFIGLQWFRDHFLTLRAYSWTDSVASRKDVLTSAIGVGAIITTPIPNPKDPERPTTSIKLNRDSPYAQTVKPRFQPIRAKGGASASEIVIRDRGRF